MSKWYLTNTQKHSFLLVRYETIGADELTTGHEECRVLNSFWSKKAADNARDFLNKMEANKKDSPYTYCSLAIKHNAVLVIP